MKIAPILAVLVVLSSLAYAEKPSAPPREMKTSSGIDRSKPAGRPAVRPRLANPVSTAPYNPKELGARTSAPGSPKQMPARSVPQADFNQPNAMLKGNKGPQNQANSLSTSPSNSPRVVVVTGDEDNTGLGATAKPKPPAVTNHGQKTNSEARSNRSSQQGTSGKPRSLVSDDEGGQVDENVETGTEDVTSGTEPASPAGSDPAKRRSYKNTPSAVKWEPSELDAAMNRQKPGAAAQQTPRASVPNVIKQPASLKYETEVTDAVRAPR